MKAEREAPGDFSPLLRPMIETIDSALRAGKREDPFQRDPELIARMYPVMRAVNLYFGTEIRGWENVPEKGPFLLVGNHSGGAEPNDFWFFVAKWVEERGPKAPLYGLTYDLLFAPPLVGPLLRRLGAIPANHANAQRALKKGAAVLVFPGGDYEVFRPWSERNRIQFSGRTGFIELAIATGVPVVPMTIHGAHQSTIVLARGRQLAAAMGITRFQVNVFPFIWNIPFGLTPAFVPTVQLPSKVTVQIDKPFDWSRYGPEKARDPAALRRCYRQITGRMQKTLDELARERPYPILSRVNELRPSQLLRRWLGD